jgi:uncharacterized protein (TIRG00374 family)
MQERPGPASADTTVTPRPPVTADEAPTLSFDRRRAMWVLAVLFAGALVLYLLVPAVGGLGEAWHRLRQADARWLGLALALQALSLVAYGLLFQGIHVPPGSPIRLRHSYLITMAGLAATRLLSAGGAGGVALTAWALRRAGMARTEVAERMVAFLVLVYGVYAAAIVTCGAGLRVGLFPGPRTWGLTILPAGFAVVAALSVWALAFLPARLRRLTQRRRPRRGPWIRRMSQAADSCGAGIRLALSKMRHPDAALVGAIGWWALNVAVLYACFRAFGQPPPPAVLVQAYFVGMLANLLPLPGGIGGVDGGMVGAFIAFGVAGNLALLAVLSYRLIAFWIPTIPGVVAYWQLRGVVADWTHGEPPPLGTVAAI